MRFIAELHPECGPGDVWWILDTKTSRYTSWSFGGQDEAETKANELNELELWQ